MLTSEFRSLMQHRSQTATLPDNTAPANTCISSCAGDISAGRPAPSEAATVTLTATATHVCVVEEPSIHTYPVLRGTFVAISVDALSSVRLLDEQARREAALITPNKCLAVVEGHANFDWSDAEGAFRLSLMFLLAGSTLPAPPSPWAAVPIEPTPPTGGPGCRLPLKPGPPLLWSPCYVHTTSSITGVVSRIHKHASSILALPREGIRELSTAVIEDCMRACDEDNDRVADSMIRGMCEDEDEECGESDRGKGEDFGNDIEDLIWRDDVRSVRLSFEMWTDATAQKGLGEPADIYAAIDQLRRIERDWATREGSKAAETLV